MKPSHLRDINRALHTAAPGRAFTVSPSTRGHAIIRDPAGRTVAVVPGTPGDVRWLRNLRADLRRAAVSRTLSFRTCSQVNVRWRAL